jgi:hypothetical protein
LLTIAEGLTGFPLFFCRLLYTQICSNSKGYF